MQHFSWRSTLRAISFLFVAIFCGHAQFGDAATVEVSNSPDDDLALAVKAIRSARRSLKINIYEFTSTDIAAAVIRRINDGLEVQILEEGEPVGGFSRDAAQVRDSVVAAMNGGRANPNVHFYLMQKKAADATRRFRYDHGKYTLVDGESLLIGSENYAPTGHPAKGAKGNRGWEVFIHDRPLAEEFEKLFAEDTDLAFDDVVDFAGARHFNLGDVTAWLAGRFEFTTRALAPAGGDFADRVSSFDATSVYKITSPDTSLAGLTGLIDGAKTKVDIETMAFPPDWGGPGKKSPLLESVEKAARGRSVRVLLNDETVFARAAGGGGGGGGEATLGFGESRLDAGKKRNRNLETVTALNKLSAEDRAFTVHAAIADLDAMGVNYIHNKGMLVDDDKTLVSSINWNSNSVGHNRETAVVIESADVHDYFARLFETDWAVSRGRK